MCNRLLIGETWTRVPFGSSTGPIGVIRDSNDFLKKLKTLDDQLCAIEATAETMAGDLKASNHVSLRLDEDRRGTKELWGVICNQFLESACLV